jgi:SecD/SecF fusion protein
MEAVGYLFAFLVAFSLIWTFVYLALGRKVQVRFGIIATCTALALMFLWPPREKLKLGIDLSGGTILVYQVVEENLRASFNMDELISALKHRVDPEGVREIPIRKIGSNRLEIILPAAEADEVEEVKRMLTDVGALQFRILASYKHDKDVADRALGPGGRAKPPSRYQWTRLGDVSTGTNPRFTNQALSDPAQNWKRNRYAGIPVELVGKDSSGVEQRVLIPIQKNTADTLFLAQPHNLKAITSYRVDYNPSDIRAGDPANPRPEDKIIREDQVAPGRVERSILCKDDRQDVDGKYLARVYSAQDERLQPAVGFVFNRAGARKFGQLTREHLPDKDGFKYQLAILLDGLVMSAPSINSEIRDAGIIEGGGQGFKPKEVEYLIKILQEGSLPASLKSTPEHEEKIGPTLGEDTIAKGILAIEVSMLVVPIFMLLYYRFAGLVAVVALVLNMILLIGSMAFMQSTFSLPGLAGLALTIGMAVDANVLVFERMREEKERGASLTQQIRNGFNRAWVTIFDSHVTQLLSSLVLWRVGTEAVKSFALTMIIGMLWNLFTAVFVSRVIFEFWLQKGWLKRLTMMKMMDRTNIDFIGPRYYCITGSILVIALGLAAFFARGQSMYNIDLTGGTLVTIRLNDAHPDIKKLSGSQRASFVRDRARNLPDVTVESLKIGREENLTRFNIRTTVQDPEKVKDDILKEFGPTLQRVEMTFSPPKPIPAAGSSAAPAPAGTARPAATDRFAGGQEFTLRFNTTAFQGTQSPAQVVSSVFSRVLTQAGIAQPGIRFEVSKPTQAQAQPAASGPTEAEAATTAEAGTAPATELIVRTDLEPDVATAQLNNLAKALQNDPDLLFEQITKFGSNVAGETRNLAWIATVASWLIIIAFLWFRFKSLTYGLAAVIALVHDVLVTLGAVAVSYWLATIPGVREFLLIEQFKIDLPMIAAFLTLIGFSVNDTIVIFDRIREIKGKTPYLTKEMINDAINQTLSRTILTSFTAWLVVVILYLIGGEGLHGFAFALVVGFLSGTYSTVYIATPILVDWISHRNPPPATAKAGKEYATTRQVAGTSPARRASE